MPHLAIVGIALAAGLEVTATAVATAIIGDFLLAASYLASSSQSSNLDNTGYGTQDNFTTTEAVLPVVYGNYKLGGNRVYITSSGENNKFLHIVITISEGPIEAVETVYLDDKETSTYNTSGLASDPNGLVYYEFFNGSGSQDVCATLHGVDANWQDSMRYTSYLYIRLLYDADKFTSVPTITYKVKGRQIYDPRNGLTAYSVNPALVWYDWITTGRYGLGVDSSYIDTQSIIDAANWCDTNGYTFNGALGDQQAFIDYVALIMSNFRADTVWTDGKYKLLIRKYDAPVMSLKEDEIVADSFSLVIPGLADTPNRIKLTYPNSSDSWKSKDVFIEDSDAVALDGEQRDTDLQLIGTTNDTQASYLGTYNLERLRLNKVFSFSAHPRAFSLEPGEVIQVNHKLPGWDSLYALYSAWAPNKAYAVGNRVKPITANGFYYECIGAGNTGATEPVWPLAAETPGNTVVDGTVTWRCTYGRLVRVMGVNLSQDGLAALTVQEEDILLYDTTLNLSPHTYFQTNLPDPLSTIAEPTGVSFIEEEYYNKDTSYTRLRVTFNPPTSPFWDYCEVWISENGSGYSHYTDTRGSFTIEPVKEGASYKVKFLSVSIQAVKAGISTATKWSYNVVGKNTPPDDVTNFKAIPQSDTIILMWDGVSNIDLMGYETRKGTNWESGIFIGFTRALTFQLNGVAPGTHTYMIKSQDTNSKYSSNYAMASCTVYGPASYTEKLSEYNDFSAPAKWRPSTVYTLGTKVLPTVDNGFYYKCTVAATSSPTEPNWPTTNGGTVTDGAITWTAYQNQVFTNVERYVDGVIGPELRVIHESDEFVAAQDLKSGGDGTKAAGWNSLNSANATGIDINTTNLGYLTVSHGAASTVFWNSSFTGVFEYKNFSGDFEIETHLVANPLRNDEVSYLIARDLNASAGEDWVGIGIGFTGGAIGLVCINTTNNVSAKTSVAVQDSYLKIKRAGNVFSLYSRALSTDTWTLRATYDRSAATPFGNSVQVGLGVQTGAGNIAGTYVSKFDYIRKANGNLSGEYLSYVYDRGSVVTRRSWPDYDYLFEGTGSTWYDQFAGNLNWNSKFGPNTTWLDLFGAAAAGTLKMSFGISLDGINWTWTSYWESYTSESQGRFVRYKISIIDVTAEGYLHCKPVTLKEAYWY